MPDRRPSLLGFPAITKVSGGAWSGIAACAHKSQEVKVGYTRKGLKPCLKPLLAVLEEAKLVAQFWLRSGNAPCASNGVGFTLELLSNLPRHLRLRLVRADSGFCEDRWLSLLEERRLAYIVVAVLHHKITSLLRQETPWWPSAVPGTDVAEVIYRGARWSRDRRLILIRHRLSTKTRTGGRMLIECPGYAYQALVTSLPAAVPPIEVWRDYAGGTKKTANNWRRGDRDSLGSGILLLKRFFFEILGVTQDTVGSPVPTEMGATRL